jgi:hypothetical protein
VEEDQTAEGLMSVDVVAQKRDGSVAAVEFEVCLEPALAGSDPSILLLVAVLGGDVFGTQGEDFGATGGHHDRGQGLVKIDPRSLLGSEVRATRPVDLRRRTVTGAVQRDERGLVDPAKVPQQSLVPQGIQNLVEERMQRLRRDRIQHLSDLIIAGDRGDAEEALGVIAATRFAHRLLVGEEGRRLGEEHREGAQPEILHRVGAVGTRTAIRQFGQCLAEVIPPPIEEGLVHAQRRWRQSRSRRPRPRARTWLAIWGTRTQEGMRNRVLLA